MRSRLARRPAVGPSAAMRPRSNTTARGHSSSASGRSWVTTTVVTSRPRTTSTRSRRAAGSRLAVGSSSTRTSGWVASTPARAARRRSPRLNWCGARSARSVRPTTSRAASTRASISSPARPSEEGPKATSARTVGRKSWSSGSWKTRPTRRRTTARLGLVTGVPPTATVPAERDSAPTRCRTNVVLPEPLGPRTATRSRLAMVRSTPARAMVPSGQVWRSPMTSTAGASRSGDGGAPRRRPSPSRGRSRFSADLAAAWLAARLARQPRVACSGGASESGVPTLSSNPGSLTR